MAHTPQNLFMDWLEQFVSLAGYTPSRGMWNETTATSQKKFVAIWSNAGRTPSVGVQYPQIRVIVTGRANGRDLGDTVPAELFAQSIIDAAIENYKTSCAINVRPLGSIMGPYYTESNRPWYEINFELTC
ncbi:hypothetical protein D3C77_366270 [compost metagenome]